MPYGYRRSYTRRGSSYKKGIQAGKTAALKYKFRGTPDNIQIYGADYKTANDFQKGMRRVAHYRGAGGYFSDLARKGGEWAGRTLLDNSGIYGKAIRGGLNAAGYTGMGMYTGHGAYKTNSLIDNGGGDGALFGDTMGAIKVSHREYITDIFGPPAGTAFNNQVYKLNPALPSTFPFLSQIASNYEEYEFAQMIWSYKSTTTDIGNSTTGQCGTVVLAVNYNAAAPPFVDKGTMMEYFGSVNVKVTEDARCGVECDPSKNAGTTAMYTRSGPPMVNQDIKTYDRGTFQLAICNSPAAYANLPIGELWVDYTVILRKPKLFTNRGLAICADEYYTSYLLPNSITNQNWTGTNPIQLLRAQQNCVNATIVNGLTQYSGTVAPQQINMGVNTGTSIVFPAGLAGNFCVTLNVIGAGYLLGQFPRPTTYYLGNVTPIFDIYGMNVNPVWEPVAAQYTATNDQLVMQWHVYIKQATGIAYSAGSTPPNESAGYWGGDNILTFANGPGGGQIPADVTNVCITITQYQSLGGQDNLDNSSERVLFVNGTSQLVVPL